ncbi:MAG: CHASE domain-containing protein [Candidatus Hydrogenedentes bacterium]|nr:CHASE domain-containing protein [Candidatus Hydrogenedentota bacterium]
MRRIFPRISLHWAPLLVLLVGFVSTAAVTYSFWLSAVSKDAARFDYSTAEMCDMIEGRLETYTTLLRGTAAHFAASEDVDATEFQRFVERTKLSSRYPGSQGIGFCQRATASDIPAIEARLRAEGFPDYHVWPDGERREYYPILYLQPQDRRNQAAIGYDMYSEAVRQAAMDIARDIGLSVASGKVTLVQEIDEEQQAGFLIYVPVYRGGQIPATVEDRREALLGFVYAPFRAGDLFESIFGRVETRLHCSIYDGTEPLAENLLYGPPRNSFSGSPYLETTVTIQIAQRPWSIHFSTAPVFDYNSSRHYVGYAAGAGLFVSVLLFLMTWAQMRALAAAEGAEAQLKELAGTLERRVQERTAEVERRAAEVKAMAAEVTQAEYRERQRLALVLHDDLQQILVATKLRLAGALLEGGETAEAANQADELLEQALQVTRTLSSDLSPPVLQERGLDAGIDWVVRRIRREHGLVAHVEKSGKLPFFQNEGVALCLLRSVRELLFNVVKHAGVTECRLALVSEGGFFRMSIQDSGVGFDLSRLEETVAADHFGLHNVRRRLEFLGGSLDLASIPGQGTTVVLTVPVDAGQTAQEPTPGQDLDWTKLADIARDDAASDGQIRVLLADDHQIVREGLIRLLRKEKDILVVGEASNGQMAVEMTRALLPHVVVMDLGMPLLNGIEATRQIKREFAAVRVIGLSMHEKDEMQGAMLEAGASAFVSKDAASGALLTAIRRLKSAEALSSDTARKV